MNTDGVEPLYKAESQQIVVDAKVIEKITDREIGQMMNNQKVTCFGSATALPSSTGSWKGNECSDEYISVHQCASVVEDKKPTRLRCPRPTPLQAGRLRRRLLAVRLLGCVAPSAQAFSC
jgi:hypothetical protein